MANSFTGLHKYFQREQEAIGKIFPEKEEEGKGRKKEKNSQLYVF